MKISPEKTAIRRKTFSKPVKKLLIDGHLKKGLLFMDFGCGWGDDVRLLQKLKAINAKGYDPFYMGVNHNLTNLLPPMFMYDVVNLGFVINVIPKRHDALQAIVEAFNILMYGGVMIVTARIGKPLYKNPIEYNDGFITKRKTFQRFFTNNELHNFIIEALGNRDFRIERAGHGMYYVFK